MNKTTACLMVFAAFMVFATSSIADTGNRQQTQRDTVFAHANLEVAWRAAVTRKRPLLVMFSTERCHYCDKMLAQTYNHPEVKRLLSVSTESVLVNARDYPDLVGRLGIRGYPSSLLVAPNGDVLDVIEGFADAKTFIHRIVPLLKNSALSSNKIPTHSMVAATTADK